MTESTLFLILYGENDIFREINTFRRIENLSFFGSSEKS